MPGSNPTSGRASIVVVNRLLPRGLAYVIGLVAASLTACSGTQTSDSANYSSSEQLGITVVDAADRKPAPVLKGDDLDGQPLSSSDFERQIIVVNLWGSWCVPCRKEAPVLQEVSAAYANKDVQFMGIDIQDNPSAARAFNRKFGITYPSIDDQSASNLLGFTKSLPTQAPPTTWIIDPEGRVAVRILGGVTSATLSGLIDDVGAKPDA